MARPASKRLTAVLTGGNHLASSLVTWLGGDFAARFPPRADPETVRADIEQEGAKALGDGAIVYDIWVCWAAIMNARHLLGDATAKPEKVYETCQECKGRGKTNELVSVEGRLKQRGREVVCGECAGQGRKQVIGLS